MNIEQQSTAIYSIFEKIMDQHIRLGSKYESMTCYK